MPIRVPCDCGKVLTAPDNLAGKRAKCPGCGKALRVPAEAGAEAVAVPKATAPKAAPPPPSVTRPAFEKPEPIELEPIELEPIAADPVAPAADDIIDMPAELEVAETPPPRLAPSRAPARAAVPARVEAGDEGEPTTRMGSGTLQSAPEEEDADDPQKGAKSRLLLLFGGMGVAFLLAVVAIIFVVRTALGGPDIDGAEELWLQGDVNGAIKLLDPNPSPQAKHSPRVDEILKQYKLEVAKNSGRTLEESERVESPDLTLSTGVPWTEGRGTARSIAIKFKNTSQKPITLKMRSFYIRGGLDITIVGHMHKSNNLPEGFVLQPGAEHEGKVVFITFPLHSASQKDGGFGGGSDQYWLIYNDGEVYVKTRLAY